MAIAGTYSFKLQRGSDDSRTLVLKAAGVPVDLTGWTPRMQIRTEDGATGTTTTATLVLEPTLVVDADPTTGKIGIPLTAAQTIVLCPDNEFTRLSYGIELFAGSPEVVQPVLQGVITVLPEVAR